MVDESTSPEAHISEDISRYAAKPGSYDRLSAFQISKFFKRHESTTKDECNRVAADILKSPVSPTPIQGATSYTVAADSGQIPKVIQFRSLKLNIELVEYARQTYKDFVPDCEYEGMFEMSTCIGGISSLDLLSVEFGINSLLLDYNSVCVRQCRTLQGLFKMSLPPFLATR